MPRPAPAPLWRTAVDLLLPSSCIGCGRPGRPLCPGCEEVLRRPATSRRLAAGLPPVWSAAGYDAAVRAALVAHKERGARGLTLSLGAALAGAVAAAAAGAPGPVAAPLVLVPVPSTRAAVRDRGEDTVAALARTAARLLTAAGCDADTAPVLRHRRRVADSRSLDAAARRRNLAGAVVVSRRAAPGWAGRVVVVVDDVVTTGASLTEAVRALRAAGVAPVGLATVAAVCDR